MRESGRFTGTLPIRVAQPVRKNITTGNDLSPAARRVLARRLLDGMVNLPPREAGRS